MYVHRTVRFIVGAILAAFVMAGVGVGAASAQTPTVAQLLQQNPSGGQVLISAIEQLLVKNPSALNTILGSVGGANGPQKTALAIAAAQAMKQLVNTDPVAAADGQEKILAVPDETFKTAAIDAFGDVKLGAIGGAPASGPLGGLAGGPGGSGPLQDIRSTPANTGPFTFGAGTTGLGFVGGSSTTSGGGCTGPVALCNPGTPGQQSVQ